MSTDKLGLVRAGLDRRQRKARVLDLLYPAHERLRSQATAIVVRRAAVAGPAAQGQRHVPGGAYLSQLVPEVVPGGVEARARSRSTDLLQEASEPLLISVRIVAPPVNLELRVAKV